MNALNRKIGIFFAFIFFGILISGSGCPPKTIPAPTPTPLPPPGPTPVVQQFSSKTPYWLQQDQSTYTRPPEGYVPVFINHLGRHGSRIYSSQKKLTKVEMFVNAQFANKQIFLGWFTPYVKVIKDESLVGSITPLGVTQLEQMGRRMVQNFPDLFAKVKSNKDKTPIYAIATSKIRTQESGDAFLKGLVSELYQDTYSVETSNNFGIQRNFPQVNSDLCDVALRFFDFCPRYTTFLTSTADLDVERVQGNFIASAEMQDTINHIIASVFSEEEAKNIDKQKVSKYIYDLCAFDSNLEPDQARSTFCSLLRNEDIARYAYLEDIKYYYAKGPAATGDQEPTSQISVKQSCALMKDWLDNMQNVVDGGTRSAYLRFAHAETVMPFAVLLGLARGETGNEPVLFKPDRLWNVARVSPMAANVQMILYKKDGTADYLVKLMLNEKEMPMPADMPECAGKIYCSWNTVKAFYEPRGCDEERYKTQCCPESSPNCDPCAAEKLQEPDTLDEAFEDSFES